MPNPPRSYRLSDETVAQLDTIGKATRASGAEVIRRFAAFATAVTEGLGRGVPLEALAAAETAMGGGAPNPSGSMACPLGYGHTAHVWELTGGASTMTGVYRCGGQPFSNGFDPIDDPLAPIRDSVGAAAPFIAEEARIRTLKDVVSRLEGYRDRIDPAIVQHFRSLTGPE